MVDRQLLMEKHSGAVDATKPVAAEDFSAFVCSGV
jgi:hypothetical protein